MTPPAEPDVERRGAPPMRRVMIVGGPGAGKSTLARALGKRTGLPVHGFVWRTRRSARVKLQRVHDGARSDLRVLRLSAMPRSPTSSRTCRRCALP